MAPCFNSPCHQKGIGRDFSHYDVGKDIGRQTVYLGTLEPHPLSTIARIIRQTLAILGLYFFLYPFNSGMHFCCWDNHQDQEHLRGKEFITAFGLEPLIEGSQVRNSGLFTGLLSGSHSTILYPRTICLGMVLTAVGWVLLHQSAIKSIPHRYARRSTDG